MEMIDDLMHLLEESIMKMNLEGYCDVNDGKMMNLEAKTTLQEELDDDDDDDEEEEEDDDEEEEVSRLCICSISNSSSFDDGGRLTLPAPLRHRHSPSSHNLQQLYGTHPDQASGSRRKRKRYNEVERGTYGNLMRSRGRGEEGCSVMRRAQEVQANLAIKFPSFVRVMLPSAVYRGFWVTLPKEFCQLHLPRHDTVVVLVGEIDEKEYKINYLAHRRALSGGWKRFSQEHNLVAGDVLIFHLIRASKFKVYIVRVNCLGEVDAALSLIDLRFHGNRGGAYADGASNSSVLNANFG